MGVKQSTLSRRISELEKRLGLRLFDRSTRGAVPTEGGINFLEEAKRILDDFDRLCISGRSIASGTTGTLGIGFSTSLAAGNMRALISDFVTRFPDLRVTGFEADRARLSQALQTRAVDFAVICGDLPELGLSRRPLWTERVMLALEQHHPLADRDRIYWPDLRGERFILSHHDPGPDLADLAVARLREPGRRPDIETHEVTRDNVVYMVSLGRYISLTTDAALGQPFPGVVLREIFEVSGGVANIAYSGYWRTDNESPALGRLLKLVGDRYPP
jgi:DNA-binding transcriptional LysR family regulator